MKKWLKLGLCGVVALVMTGANAAVVIPAPPASDETLEQWQKLNSGSAVKQSFIPMKGSLPAEWSSAGYIRLPVNFVGTSHDRASWDIKLDLDLRRSNGVEFDFFCSNVEPFYGFSLYLRSGKGWYSASFFPEIEGGWHRIKIAKSEMKSEGEVGGWEGVDLVRISGWRARDIDTECAVANFAMTDKNPLAVVITADSNISPGNGESMAFATYAATVAETLDSIGVASHMVADINVTPEALVGIKLAVLPYNPRLPDEMVEHLRSFVQGGGKLMVFYALPSQVGSILGLQADGSSVPQPDTFAGFARVGKGVASQPEFTPQSSWRTTLVKPRQGVAGRVIATWRDSKGSDTGMPAVTLVPDGIFVGHVWLAGNSSARQALMQAMIFELVPEAVKRSAEVALANVAKFDGYNDIGELCRDLRGKSQSDAQRAAVAEAEKQYQVAEGFFKGEAWLESLAASKKASEAALYAWYILRPSKQGEHRAFWCHSAFGLSGKGWDESIRFLKEGGFNAVLPNMLWGGVAYYNSSVLPVHSSVAERGDQIAECLAACQKYGVACHVWKVNWNMHSHAPKSFVAQMVREARVQKLFDGTVMENWLCPSHPANQDLEVAAMVEIVRKYKVDGIHFDYIRYPDNTTCFCDGCRARFEAKLGHAVANWPADTRQREDVRQAWLDFRRANIDVVVKRVHQEAQAVRADIQVSAAVFSNWARDRDGVGQDWKMWCEQGWLDFVCPMNYTDVDYSFRNMVVMQQELVGKAKLYPGIGLSCWKKTNDGVKLANQIEIVRELGLSGFTVFNFDSRAVDVLPSMRLGTTAK